MSHYKVIPVYSFSEKNNSHPENIYSRGDFPILLNFIPCLLHLVGIIDIINNYDGIAI